MAIDGYNQKQEEARQTAIDSAKTTKDEIQSLEDYKKKISKLRTALDSGTLSQEESNQKRKELLSIQDALQKKYGKEVEGRAL
jgi:histone acetyltransferase (RNA polymerase elongator complex component)